MVVITGICLVAQSRRRPLPPAAARAGRRQDRLLARLARLLLFDEDVFIYLLNFLVDGFLALLALWLWSLAGGSTAPAPG
jgi:hypothetical protein